MNWIEAEYAGMDYMQASKEAQRLLLMACNSGNWFALIDRLTILKGIMEREQWREESLSRLRAQ